MGLAKKETGRGRSRKKPVAKIVFLVLILLLAGGMVTVSANAGIGAVVRAKLAHFTGTKKQTDLLEGRKKHWNPGDTVIREIDGEPFCFRCIDGDYQDEFGYHRGAALFLCDTVIPANHGSRYEFETSGDSSHGYVFYPGPIVNFGSSGEYKYSSVRSWLNASGDGTIGEEPINTGVFRAYSGCTPDKLFRHFSNGTLRGDYIGSQKMTDRIFILSVDEAFRYREWLWRFEGAQEENPESQYGAFCKGYWLRNPAGDRENYDTDFVYIVDLINGNIHPSPIAPVGVEDTEDAELQVTGTIGVRPAFVLPQD